MKAPATADEQIGTSAIDLFASGMGAFMLIALLFMVMFAATPRQEVPDTPQAVPECPECPPVQACPQIPEVPPCPEVPECPECPPVQACPEVAPCPEVSPCPEAPECPECPECPEAPAVPDPIPPTSPEPAPTPEPAPVQSLRLPDTDLVFVIDTTSSMRDEIESLKRELHIVVEILERMMPTVGVGVVTFNDRLQRPQARHYPVRRLTGDDGAMREIQRFLRTISIHDAQGPNPDLPEAVLAALTAATTTSFRPEIKDRVLIIITDAYAYSDEVAATLSVARSFAAVEGQRISTVHVRQSQESENYLRRLAEAGGGEFVPDRGSILANILLGLL